jgi:hypothetical protein
MTAENEQGLEIPIEPDEIEANAHAAQAGQASAQFDATGRLARTVITTKDFLAGADSFEYVNGLGRGEIAFLGTLAGEIYSVQRKESEWQGKQLESYWLSGHFQAVVRSTGEVFTASEAILPKSYAKQIANAFKDLGVIVATCQVVVGLRLSGRPGIPYEWVVRDHVTMASHIRVAAMSDQLQGLLSLDPPLKRLAAG